jgi:putative colanic acid biosynthesis acetyltransferase WcaF
LDQNELDSIEGEMNIVDVAVNRQARKWTRRELAGRIFWAIASLAFRWSPRPAWAWRRMLLRLFGAQVGREVHIYPTVRIIIPWNLTIGNYSAIGDRALIYNLGAVTIGECVTISHQAQLCAGTHDYRRSDFPLIKSPIAVGKGAWICADAFIGPGVKIGENAIVSARAVAMKDVPTGMIAVGNPAHPIKQRAGSYPDESVR